MIPRDAQDAQAAAAKMAESAVQQIRTLWPDLEGFDGAMMRERILTVLPGIVDPHYEAAAGLAADWYSYHRPVGADPFQVAMAELIGPGRYRALVYEAIKPMFQAKPNFVWTQERVEGLVEEVVLTGFRETIQLASEQDHAVDYWTRVLSPGACTFCRKFAGERYRKAGQFKSHGHCRCTNAPRFRSDLGPPAGEAPPLAHHGRLPAHLGYRGRG